jgi:radical SAM family RiPP maturation amino acid epimerase
MSEKNANNYMKVLEAFTQSELDQISQIKRFFECYDGDADFRASVNSGHFSDEQINRMKQIGIEFDPAEMSPLWENPDSLKDYILKTNSEFPPDHAEKSSLDKYPLLELWLRFALSRKIRYKEVCTHRYPPSKSKRYEKWRSRRIAAAESELGGFNHYIDHPTLAIELADGCSVQCWFCSFCAGKLKAVLDYEKNKAFFRDVVMACNDVFGQAAGLALLYYATEPYDNPHYIDFMKDFANITGSDVCTSTAVCTDKKWIDDLTAFYRPKNLPWPRLSVLSPGMLRKIHDNHTPQQLLHVNMIMQMKDSERPKVSGGRIFEQKRDMRERDSTNYLQDIVPQGTIACVSGFYINLVTRVIKLVSPCYTSQRWPLGYRVYDEATFDTAEDFRRAVLQMIERNMPETPPGKMLLKLRDDLVCKTCEDGFDLLSPNQIHHFRGKKIFRLLGDLLTGLPITFEEALNLLVESGDHSFFEAQAVLNNLFHNGFLDETGYSSKL